jgi:hypothetical protein
VIGLKRVLCAKKHKPASIRCRNQGREEVCKMIRRLCCLLLLALCLTSLTACVVEPAPGYGRPGAVWIPGHYNGWHWEHGHWA